MHVVINGLALGVLRLSPSSRWHNAAVRYRNLNTQSTRMKSPLFNIALFVCSAAIACLSAGSAHAQVTASQIYQGLVSYWPMDTITGGATPDVVSSINLTAVNSPTTTSGKYGNGIVLNGTSQYLANTDTQWLGGGTNNLASGLPYFAGTPFTVAFWIKANTPAAATKYMFTMGNTTNTFPIYALQSGSGTSGTFPKLDVFIRPIQNNPPINHNQSTNNFLDGNWHHVAWVDNYGVVSVYEDGLPTSPGVFSYFPKQLTSPNAISGSSGGVPTDAWAIPLNTTSFGALLRGSAGGFLAGTFDDAAIWNRALSQGEIQYVMTNSITTPVTALKPGFAVPLTDQTNAMGDYVILKANAYGTPPLTLQWYENGVALPNANNQVLNLFNLTSSGTNVIYVTATNPNGATTNGPFNLVVPSDPTPALSIGCYGYWPLDTLNITASATNTPDLYNGNNFNGANLSAANVVSGEFTNALDFGSSAGYAYLDNVIPAFNSQNYTVSFWVNAPASTAQANGCVFGNTSSSSTQPLFLLGYSSQNIALNNLVVLLRQDQAGPNPQLNFVEAASTVFDGTWHHVTWVDKAGSVTLYVDGVIDPVDFSYIRTNANPALRPNQTWTFTAECLANRWSNKATFGHANCQMDDVAWWNRALSYTEVHMLQTNTVPAPTALVPPAIGTQPASLTNAYVGDTDTFTVVLSAGTVPLSYQWYYTNSGVTTAINTTLNPSAATASLILTNVQLTNTGYYFVIVTNGATPGSGLTGGGATNSVPALLVVHNYTPSSTTINTTILQLEFNAVSAPANVQPGFQSMTLASTSVVFNNATRVTVSPLNGAVLADRDRNSAAVVTNSPPALTTAFLYNSFIFDNSTILGTGIDILIQHLAPNTAYGVNLWSYDEASGGPRISDWVEAISNTTIASHYTFNGNNHPTNNWQNTLGALLTSDPSGELDIQGTQNGLSSGFGVFLNALTVTANPVPVIKSVVVGTDGNLVITAQAQYSGQTLYFQESPDLINWQDATDGVNATQNGPIVTSEFPLSANNMFYRVATQP